MFLTGWEKIVVSGLSGLLKSDSENELRNGQEDLASSDALGGQQIHWRVTHLEVERESVVGKDTARQESGFMVTIRRNFSALYISNRVLRRMKALSPMTWH